MHQKSMRAIAQGLNVSVMTLYRVINNAPCVSQTTRKRVIAALDSEGILEARSNTRSTLLIDVQDSFYRRRFAKSLLDKIGNRDYRILTSNHRKSRYHFLKMTGEADTVIFFSSPSSEIVQAAKKENPDIFCINVSGGNDGDIIIGINNYLGGSMAAKYLYSKGHRRIAVATTPIEPTQLDRHKGFIGEMSLLPHGKAHALFFTNSWKRLGKSVIRLIRDKGITALFVTCDHTGFQLLHYLLNNGIRIPEDLSLLSYDTPEEVVSKRPMELDTVTFDEEQIIRLVQYYLNNRRISNSCISCHCLIAPEVKEFGSVKYLTE